jgi:CCR4-NOT transcriptional complex subunit CAF120
MQIESLPMNGSAGGQLQNVLSISTAANNRYLLHFNSLNSLTQWTAGLRLAMYEHTTLQEAYTGSLIAGKGKMLNNIRTIMERSKFVIDDWARVRFGAGTPWRRCWCVITPPNEKEWAKYQKALKKRDTYERRVEVPKGDIKFYEKSRVTKKTRPIATIKDAFAAYAIYPQSKPLIDQSTLIKLEGQITIHGAKDTTTEGFLFVMPEVHPAVSGFEMMLRWLFPVWDIFALYGRPNRLIADSLDQRGLMFAMPRDRRYGYLDILDVSGLIHTKGSQLWTEQDWRREMKKLTSHRMNSADDTPPQARGRRNTLSLNQGTVRFGNDSSTDTSPSPGRGSPGPGDGNIQFAPPRRVETTPVSMGSPGRGHHRSASDALGYKRFQTENRSRLSYEATSDLQERAPEPPVHRAPLPEKKIPTVLERVPSEETPYEQERPLEPAFEELKLRAGSPPTGPVASPPKLMHGPNARPTNLNLTPELRRANSAMDAATLQQLAEANKAGTTPYIEKEQFDFSDAPREVSSAANGNQRSPADPSFRNEEVILAPGPPYQPSSTHRLPPIPASPYNSPAQPVAAPARSNQTLLPPPTLPPYSNPSPAIPARKLASPPLAMAAPISRKPVPTSPEAQHASPMPPQSPTFSQVSSNGSLQDEIMQQALLEQMLQQSPEPLRRVISPADSITDDDDSVDYSSVKSMSPPKRKPFERSRTGRLKTVGNPEHEPQARSRFDTETGLPINFGPTLTYKPNARPSTAGNMPIEPQEDSELVQRPSSRLTQTDSKGSSFLEPRKPVHGDSNQDRRRSVAWQPAAVAGESVDQGLTAEQWVQYRASLAAAPLTQSRATPVFGHQRNQSSATRTTKTPPLSRPASRLSRTLSGDWTQQLEGMSLNRTPSGDWGQQANRMSTTKTPPPLSRTPSGDWSKQVPSRPHSRNAGTLLNPPSPGRTLQLQGSALSAHEQMQVARMTGSSMINLTERDKRRDLNDLDAPGLVGAMAVRERQRNIKRDGLRNNAVQQAVAARQQQQLQDDYSAQIRAQIEAQEYAQQQAELHAQNFAHQQAQYYAQQYAQQQAQQAQQAQFQQQIAMQQAQQYQIQLQLQQQQAQVNHPYASGPGSAQQRSSQHLGHMSQGGGWSNAGSPHPQPGYAQSYFGQGDGQHRQQQRRYQH